MLHNGGSIEWKRSREAGLLRSVSDWRAEFMHLLENVPTGITLGSLDISILGKFSLIRNISTVAKNRIF